MNNTIRKLIAVICGVLLLLGVFLCVFTKQDDLIGTVVLFGLVYVVYLIVLSRKLKKDSETDSKKETPLKRR